MNKPTIKIDVISDVVCPWCYIGKKRLGKAVEQLKDHFDFEIYYHPFELNPSLPKEGVDQKSYLTEKFGGSEKYEKIVRNLSNVGAEEGIVFNYPDQAVCPNTFDIHRIIWLAGKEGKQEEILEAFYKAYFEQATDLTKKDTLVSIAAAGGMDAGKVRQLLDGSEAIMEVRAFEGYCREIGVSGVPFFIVNDKYAISGAQPTEVFLKALPDISVKMSADGPSCDLEGNC